MTSTFFTHRPADRRRLLLVALGYILVWLSLWYSASVLDTLGVASLWYLPAGLRFFILLSLGWAGFGLELASNLVLLVLQWGLSGNASAPAAGSVYWIDRAYNLLVFPLAYACLLLPLRRRLGTPLDFTRVLNGTLLIAAALGCSALSAAAGVLNLHYMGVITQQQCAEVFGSWLVGDFIGIITLAPWLLVVLWPRLRQYLLQGHWPRARLRAPHARIAGWTALVVVLPIWLVLGLPRLLDFQQAQPLITLLLFVPLIAVALRFRLRGAAWAIVMLESGMVAMMGLLGHSGLALQYQLVMVALALVGLWLGGTAEVLHKVIRRLKDFSRISNDLLWETDTEGRLRISGRLAAQIPLAQGASWRSLLSPVAQPSLLAMEEANSQQQPYANLEVAMESGKHEPLWLRINGIPLWDETGAFTGYRGTASDISDAVRVRALLEGYNQKLLAEVAQRTEELNRSNHDLWAMAHTDVLTDLPNRSLFLDRCTQTLTLSRRMERSAALLWIDLDGFKAVNDSLGHAAGDSLLRQVALRLKTRARESDTVARIGGDEFAAILSDVNSPATVVQFANELVASLGVPFDLPQGRVHISASIGVALYPLQAQDLESLMRCADVAMYNAKRAGKNRVHVWSDSNTMPLNLSPTAL